MTAVPTLTRAQVRKRMRARLLQKPRRYQRHAVYFIEKHNGNVLIGDDMGLGKTFEAIIWLAIHKLARPVAVVCPASMKYKWRKEFKEKAGLRAHVVSGMITTPEQDAKSMEMRRKKVREKKFKHSWQRRQALQNIRRSMKAKKALQKERIRDIAGKKILIINHDIIDGWVPTLIEMGFKVLIIDECHYVKNRTAKRTVACKALSRKTPHVMGLSGTPISGKPAELFPILQMIRPREFPSFWKYAMEYCAPKKNEWGKGWDFSGTSNLDELHKRLKKVMIRRMKEDVLDELPAKQRTVLPVEITNRKEYKKVEEDFLSWILKKKGKDAMDSAARAEALVRMRHLKILAAEGKMKTAIQWIRDWMEETDQKLIVFGIHKVILSKLKKEFPDAAVIDGSVSSAAITKRNKNGKKYETSKRQIVVDKFQNDPKQRLLLGQLKAAGEGIDLIAANNVLFLELGWTPIEHDQAEDRTHRYGQKRKVNVYYMIGRRTIEERILDIIHEKDGVVNQVLNGKKGTVMRLLDLFRKGAA